LKVGAKPYSEDKIYIVHKATPCTEDTITWRWRIQLDRYGGLDAPITFEIWNPSVGTKNERPVAFYRTTLRALTFWKEGPFMYLRAMTKKKEKAKLTTNIKSRTILMEIINFKATPDAAHTPVIKPKSPQTKIDILSIKSRVPEKVPLVYQHPALNRSNSAVALLSQSKSGTPLEPASLSFSRSNTVPPVEGLPPIVKPKKKKDNMDMPSDSGEGATLKNSQYFPETGGSRTLQGSRRLSF